MGVFSALIRPPEPDEEYIERIRQLLKDQRTGVTRSLLASVASLGLFFLAWYFLEWSAHDLPEMYIYRASGVYLGMAGGMFVGLSLFSLGGERGQRALPSLFLIFGAILVTVLLVFAVPPLLRQWIKGDLQQAGFNHGVTSGLLSGFLLHATLHHAICASRRLGGGIRAKELLLKYHDVSRQNGGDSHRFQEQP